MKRRILHVINDLQSGGAEKLLYQLLSEINYDHFEVEVCTLFSGGDLEGAFDAKNIAVHGLNLKHRWQWPQGVLRLMRILKQRNIEMVHTHLYEANVVGRLAAKGVGISRLVTTLHNPDYSFENHGGKTYMLRKWLDRWTGRWCQAHIAVSKSVQEDYLNHFRWSNICIIHNGISAEVFSKNILSVEEIKKQFGLAPNDFVISHVGRLCFQKGQEDLIMAFKNFCHRYPDAKLLIAGQGALLAKLKQLSFPDLNRRIFFLGKIYNVPELLHISDLFILPSRYEGFGIAAIEAMYAKAAVIATQTGGLEEIIEDRNNGLLVPVSHVPRLTDAMILLRNDVALRKRISEAGHKTVVERFLIHHAVQKLETFYQEIFDGAC
ncbi:MAG: glycosyltransferase family 4 protein [Deltaproteobacteria bacterium]|nr:glycosyltransferase family 4 protein [Deltaproteobacteria bacterium]